MVVPKRKTEPTEKGTSRESKLELIEHAIAEQELSKSLSRNYMDQFRGIVQEFSATRPDIDLTLLSMNVYLKRVDGSMFAEGEAESLFS